MKVSYLVVSGLLSRMVEVRGACDKPFWVYKRLNKLRGPPRRKSDDVVVVEELAVTPHGNASSSHWRAARTLAPVCVFLTILIGGHPELFSRLLAISSGSEATGFGGSSAVIIQIS